jgi:hypothetical protein
MEQTLREYGSDRSGIFFITGIIIITRLSL